MSSHKWMEFFFTNYMQKETKLFTIRAPKHEEKKKPECVKNMLLSNSVESVCLRWREQLTLFQPLCFCTETLILALQADMFFAATSRHHGNTGFPLRCTLCKNYMQVLRNIQACMMFLCKSV